MYVDSINKLPILLDRGSNFIVSFLLQPPLEESSDDSKKSPPDSDKKEAKGDSLNSPFMEINTVK